MKRNLIKLGRHLKSIIFGSILLIALTGCVDSAFYWGGSGYYHDLCRYRAKPDEANKKEYLLSLKMVTGENTNLDSWKIPPSTRLELSELLYKENEAKAAKLCKEELRLFPEAQKFVDLLLLAR